MQPETPVATQPTASFDKQLADIKSQAAKIVTSARKQDPKLQISTADAEMIGLPKVNIPTQKRETSIPTELSTVGTTVIPKTSQQVARETILSQVPEEDRDTIDQILGIATGFQTEKGRALESTAESLMTQQLSNIQSARDKALESSKMKETAMLPELEAELESIRGEADVLEARRNSAIQAEARRSGVSTSAQQGNINAIDRDFNLEKANLAIRELASVGKINAATKLIDTKLNLKYGDLEAETALLTAQINAISPFLSREDQKAAETRLQLNEIVKTKIADAREADKQLEEFKLQSYLFAQQNGATPATLSQIMSSTSREDVASVGGSFIQDPMQKLQMEATRANTAASWALANERMKGGETFTTPQGSQISVPTFDDFINEKQNELGMTLTPAAREKYRKEYEDETQIMGQAARVASLSPIAREVVNNPQAYYDLTPSVRGEIFEELAKKGIDTNNVISGKKKALPATQASDLAQASGVKNDVEKLYSMLKSLPGTGPISGRLQGLNPYHPQRVAIDAQITRIIPGLARGIFQEVGVLTDQDMERYRQTLANPNMTDQQIELLHGDTMSKIDQSINATINTFSSLGYDLGKFSETLTQGTSSTMSDEDAYSLYLKMLQQ